MPRSKAPVLGPGRQQQAGETAVDEQTLWARKRERQRADRAALEAGTATEGDFSWLSHGRARACRLLDSSY